MTVQQAKNLRKQRLVGIDLGRGIAAYAVIVIHAYAWILYSAGYTDRWIASLAQLSRFAVPFFLAASFYLMTNKIYVSEKRLSVASNLRLRFVRLLIPYLLWSGIYISFRMFKALSAHNELNTVLQDPVGIIFFGSASIHLYFLPLLFSGSFLIIMAESLVRKQINLKAIVLLLLLSIFTCEFMRTSGNGFNLGIDTNCLTNSSSCSSAFQSFIGSMLPSIRNNQVLRVLMVEIAWLLECLPYLFIGMILNYPSIVKTLSKLDARKQKILFSISIIAFSIFSLLGLLNTLQIAYLPRTLYDLGTGGSLLLFSILLSNNWQENRFIENLGKCSFGIYLMHYLVLVCYGTFMNRILLAPLKNSPVLIMLSLATLTFFTSWASTSLTLRRKTISRFLFGV